MIFCKWKHSSSVVRGNDHVENGLPCQDNVFFKVCDGVHAIALSDGAGSKEHSQIGSKVATMTACECLIEEFDNLYMLSEEYGKSKEEIEESNRLIRETIFNRVKKALIEEINDLISFDDLACTLLFFAKKGDKCIIGHIGDGVIAGLFNSTNEDVLRVLSHPENGAQINITFFLTDPDALEHFRVTCTRLNNLVGVMLMSDGPEEVLYHPINGMHVNCLKLFHNFDNHTQDEYDKIIERFLSTQVAKYSYDDLSVNMLYLTSIDSTKMKKHVVDDLFMDIKNLKQVVKKSSYSIFLDNSRQYKDKDDLSSIRGL